MRVANKGDWGKAMNFDGKPEMRFRVKDFIC